jgi:putative ABC transport system permease protein
VEFALALTLLAGAELTLHRLWNQMHADFGVRIDHVLTFDLPLAMGRLTTMQQMTEYNRVLLEKLQAVPGVEHVAAVQGVPLTAMNPMHLPFTIAGKHFPETTPPPPIAIRLVSPDFFQTFGVQLRKGRTFKEQDRADSVRVAMVNEKFVSTYLAGMEPIMQEILLGGDRPGHPPLRFQIVGVFRNIDNAEEFGSATNPEMMCPLAQFPQPLRSMAVRTSSDPEGAIKSFAAAVHSIDPELPLAHVETMQQIIHERLGFDRFEAWVYGSFAGLALLLCAVGIYSLMAFVVSQRTPELGLRMALGASRSSVVQLILREGCKLAIVGLAFGVAGAYYSDRVMQASLYGTRAMNMGPIIVVGVVLLGVAVLACVVPARRAASVDPMVALRSE